MNIQDILKCTSGKLVNEIDLKETFNKIKINSKEIKKDDIYIAIIGEKHDGHDFIDEAIYNGAKLIITSKKMNTTTPYIITNDTTISLGDIASYMIKKYKPTVIAITGSVGKTTTRNLIYNLLKNKYRVLTNEKNYNNNIGVPLTVFNINEKTEILLLELGMNHPKEISYLSKMINPKTCIITNIGSSHIGYLKSKENILKAKLEILDGMKEKNLFINGDDDLLKNLKNTHTSGFNKNNELVGYDIKSNLYQSSFKMEYNNNEYEIEVDLPRHLLNNVILAVNVALYYNIEMKDIIRTLRKYKTFNMRMNIIKDNFNNEIINDCYNSSFESLTGILKVLENEKREKLLIIGDIKELGELSCEIHQNIKPYLDRIKDKKVILIGNEVKNIQIDALYFNDYRETIEYLKSQDIKNKIILVKGSRSLKLENITEYLLSKKL